MHYLVLSRQLLAIWCFIPVLTGFDPFHYISPKLYCIGLYVGMYCSAHLRAFERVCVCICVDI